MTRGPRGAAVAVVAGGLIALALVSVWHLTLGDAGIGLGDLWDAVQGTARPEVVPVLEGARFPRLLAGVLVGAALGAAGAVFQTASRNPLADSSTLAVSSGAWFTVVVAELVGWQVGGYLRGATALVGGVAAAALVLAIARAAGSTPARLVLTGTTVHLTLAALTALLLLQDEVRAAGLFFWGQGTLVQVDSTKGLQYVPIVVGVLVLLVVVGPRLDLLRLDDDSATSLGARPGRDRIRLMGAGVTLAAAGVAVAGPLSFVGLVAPRVALGAGVRRHRVLLPAAAVWGAVVVVAADAAVQSLRAWVRFSELPAGVATALLGAPVLLVLARRLPAGDLGGPGTGRVREALATKRSPGWALGAAVAALLLAMLAGLVFGEVDLPWRDALAAVFGGADELTGALVREDRLPRVLVAALAGCSLAVAGVIVQAVGRNPLAEPGLMGITGGASVGALGLLILAPAVPAGAVPIAAFVGAMLALGVVIAASWKDGLAPERLLLVGISVSAFSTALVSLMVVLSGPQVAAALVWLTGSTYARGMADVVALVGWPAVLVPLLWLAGRHLDLMALGEDVPRSLGLPLDRARLGLLCGGVLLAAAAAANVGVIGFIGLIAPHLARSVTGNRHRWTIPLAAVLGALLLVLADLVGRTVNQPAGVPSGLVVAVVGAPAFLGVLVWRARD